MIKTRKMFVSIGDDFICRISVNISFRNPVNRIGRIVTRVCIGNIKRKNFTEKHKKRTKLKRSSTVYRISTTDFRFNFNEVFVCFSVTGSRKDIETLRKSLREINDRVVTLEKLMIGSHILLEKIQAKLEEEDKSLPDSQIFVHILSRKSPYVYTNEARFPVTERHIPWRVCHSWNVWRI